RLRSSQAVACASGITAPDASAGATAGAVACLGPGGGAVVGTGPFVVHATTTTERTRNVLRRDGSRDARFDRMKVDGSSMSGVAGISGAIGEPSYHSEGRARRRRSRV